jgi:hypothetical protein
MSHMRGGRLRFTVMNRRLSGILNRGEHSNRIRRRQHLTPHTIAQHHTMERRQHRHQHSAQVTALLQTHVDFVVTIMQWDVVFVPQQTCSVSIALKWAMWPRFAVAVLRLQIPTGLIHARGVHPFALGVRVNLRRLQPNENSLAVNINFKPTLALIDTDAVTSCISEHFACVLRLIHQPTLDEVKLISANKSPIRSLGTVNVDIAIQGLVVPFTLHVL